LTAEIAWLSTAEAAKRLGITPRTLYRFIDQGDIPAYRFGRVIRLKEAEVDSFIESCRIEPGTLEHLYPEPIEQPK
jgi:excisionase family DNA binding protein